MASPQQQPAWATTSGFNYPTAILPPSALNNNTSPIGSIMNDGLAYASNLAPSTQMPSAYTSAANPLNSSYFSGVKSAVSPAGNTIMGNNAYTPSGQQPMQSAMNASYPGASAMNAYTPSGQQPMQSAINASYPGASAMNAYTPSGQQPMQSAMNTSYPGASAMNAYTPSGQQPMQSASYPGAYNGGDATMPGSGYPAGSSPFNPQTVGEAAQNFMGAVQSGLNQIPAAYQNAAGNDPTQQPKKKKFTIKHHQPGCLGNLNSGIFDKGEALGFLNIAGCLDRDRLSYSKKGSSEPSIEGSRKIRQGGC